MMDNSGTDVSRDEVRRAVRQAILLNEYLLRRAWGVLYIVIAFSMFLSSFGSPILESLGVVNYLGALVMDLTASGSGLIVILWAFKGVRNTAEVTHPNDQAWARLLGYKFLVPLWFAINTVLISTIIFARELVSLEFFLIHFGLAIYLYYALSLSFSLKLPPEASVSIGSILLSSVASLALLSIVTTPGIYALLSVATIVAWIFSGVYASTRAIPEFEEEHDGLE
jgi:hypothetical protein